MMNLTSGNKIFLAIFLTLSIVSWTFVLTSCVADSGSTPPKAAPEIPNVTTEGERVGEAAVVVGEIGKDVGTRAEKIESHATAIETKTPLEVKPLVQPEVDGIRIETKGLREDSAILSATEQKLQDTQRQILEQQKNIEKYTAFAKESELHRTKLLDKIKDLESSNAKMLKAMLSWIVVFCVIGIGVSLMIGFWFKTPTAFMVAAGCVATMGVAVAVTLYLQQIAWVALAVLGLGFVAAVVYVFFQIKNRDRAVKELVHTGEVAKTYLPIEARDKIFGNAVEPGVAHQIQSSPTMQLIKKIRSQEKDKRGYGLAPNSNQIAPAVVNVSPILPTPVAIAVVPTNAATASPAKTIIG